MQISLAHQVALVTGASSGLGAASARALAAAGASVVINLSSVSGLCQGRTPLLKTAEFIAIGAGMP